MSRSVAFATKLPSGLVEMLDRLCERFGLRKNFVVETALRDKLEDLLDTHDLQEAMQDATGFHSLESVRKQIKRGS